MDLTFEELTKLGCRQCIIDYMSMAPDVLRLEFSGTLVQHPPLPFAAGDALRVIENGECVFRGWVTNVESSIETQIWVTSVEVKNVVAVLDSLPVEESSYEDEQHLESACDLVKKALSAAQQCAILDNERFEVHLSASVMAVFSSGTESVWSNILAATRWVPNAASWYDHRTGTLHIMGGTVAVGNKASARVVFGNEMQSGTLVVGMSRLDVTKEWMAEPAVVAEKLLHGNTEVAAKATGAYTLELTARAPGGEGNALMLEFEAGTEGDMATVEAFGGGDYNRGMQITTLESLQQSSLPGSVVSVSCNTTAWEVPPVVALRGRYKYTLPAGENIFQPGAFVYHVPKKDVGMGGNKDATEVQRTSGTWNIVKGYLIPPGWQSLNDGKAVDMREEVSDIPAHHEFWAKYLPEIRKTNVSCLAFGTAVFEPIPVSEAYPEEDEDDETSTLSGVTKWRPPLLESKNGPANYEEFSTRDTKKLYVCYEGQFPASSEKRGNVSGLKFCRGTLRQYVWLKGPYTGMMRGTDVMAFFAGSMKVPGTDGTPETVSYTQLTLDGVFINRRRTRYQSGTNGQPKAIMDADPDDSEQNGTETSTELTKRDYIQALSDYYYSSRPVGTHGSMRLAGVNSYRHSAELGVLKSVRWNPTTGELTLTTGAGGPVGVEAILQRQQVGKMQALADFQGTLAQASQEEGDETGEDAEKNETDNYPMVGAGAVAAHRVDAKAAKLEPFAVYMDDDGRMMMNGGPLPSPVGIIDVEPTDISSVWRVGREFYVKARWNRSTKGWEAVVLYRDPKKEGTSR